MRQHFVILDVATDVRNRSDHFRPTAVGCRRVVLPVDQLTAFQAMADVDVPNRHVLPFPMNANRIHYPPSVEGKPRMGNSIQGIVATRIRLYQRAGRKLN